MSTFNNKKFPIKKKRYIVFFIIILFIIGILVVNIVKQELAKRRLLVRGKILAEKFCTSCHLLPDPQLLTRDLWNFNVLPNMGLRLGMKSHLSYYYPPLKNNDTPLNPVMSQEDWNILVYYYLKQAPDSLNKIKQKTPPFDNKYFIAEKFSNITGGIITNLKSINNTLFIAEASKANFHEFNIKNEKIKSTKYEWPITDIDTINNKLLLTSPGYLHPADHQMGKIIVKESGNDPIIIIDSLRRSLRTEIFDFDNNGFKDLLICEFGHNYGQLSLYFNDGTNYNGKVLSGSPGAIIAEVQDFNNDSLLDFMVLFAQGDERLILYLNQGNQKFLPKMIKKFPSIYGSIYFELADFNNDDLIDILYINGDNGDYTPIPKPYHGLRILINKGNHVYAEEWFYPMYGASMAKTFDFDQDGYLDIIATSNFTESGKPTEEGLVFFHQENYLNFEPYIYKKGNLNQWNLLELMDIDFDGDQDVLVGAMNLDAIRLQRIDSANDKHDLKPSILLLRNNAKM